MRWMAFIAVLWGGSAAADTPRVVADIPPVHSLVAQVMAGVGTPALLLDGTSSPHGGSLRPSQARALAGADLTVWMGPAMTPWLGEAIRGEGLALLAVDGTHVLDLREGGTLGGDGHDHDHGHEGEGEAGDPHVWLDPDNGILFLSAIAAQLGAIDPENAQTYDANAQAGIEEITKAEADIQAQLAPVRGVAFVVLHDGFHYFEDHFGVEATGAIAPSDAETPGAARVQELREALKDRKLRCAFSEPNASDKLITTVTEGLDVKVRELDLLGAAQPLNGQLYVATLRAMGDSFVDCLG